MTLQECLNYSVGAFRSTYLRRSVATAVSFTTWGALSEATEGEEIIEMRRFGWLMVFSWNCKLNILMCP